MTAFLPARSASCVGLFTVFALVWATSLSLAQRLSPAAGPWLGQAQCVVVAKWADYHEEQTHTWRLTGAPPKAEGVIQVWPATWSVQGSGRRLLASAAGGEQPSERWTIDSGMSAPLSIWELAGGVGRIRIGSRHGVLSGPIGSISVTPSSGRTISGSIQEWPFPVIEDVTTATTISGNSTRTVPKGFAAGWRQPREAITTETCTWSFARNGVDQSSTIKPPQMTATTIINPAVLGLPTQQTPISGPQPSINTSGTASPARPIASPGSTPPPGGLSPVAPGTAAGAAILGTTVKPCSTTAAPQFSATPGSVTFTLNRPAGTTGYRISRQDLGELTPTPVTASSYTHAAPLEYQTTYQYVISGVQSDGGCTTASVSVTPPRPLTPQVTARVTPTGQTGRVTLSWGAQADRPDRYLVLGAGLAEAGREVPAATNPAEYTVDIESLPPGTHNWLVLPVWTTPSGNMSDVALAARVSTSVPRTFGRYRIVINGFRANNETYDDQLNFDGQHDEVYASAAITVLDRRDDSILQPRSLLKSATYGDANQSSRIRAGSATAQGGIANGDLVPDGSNPWSATGISTVADRFPFKVWEGVLNDGVEVVVINPVLWEADGGQQNYLNWANPAYFTRTQPSRVAAQAAAIKTRATNADLNPFRGIFLFSCTSTNTAERHCANGHDRPIGVNGDGCVDGSGSSPGSWCELTMVFTREAIERLLASPYQVGALGPGVVVVPLVEPLGINGNYEMFIRVERVP